MRKPASRRTPKALAFVVASLVVGAVMLAAGALATPTLTTTTSSFNLCATTGTLQPLPTTDPSVQVPIWGFVAKGTMADCSDVHGSATLPGPVLDVNEGDDITVNVTSDLPVGHLASLEFPGLIVDTNCTPPAGATACFHFNAGRPGTFEYHSPGDAGRQAAMGLYGALVVRSGTAGQAYDDASTAYDVEAPLVLSAVDPAFNADPDNFDMHAYNATYWMINGLSYPDTEPITASPGQKVLLRYVNDGYDNTTMTLVGSDQRVVARDAYLLGNPFSAVAETIPAGATEDAIVSVPAGSTGLPNGLALFNRQFHITNGTNSSGNATYSPGYSPGGMMTFIRP